MKITHISTSDVRGGAARAAYRLHQGMLAADHDSRMLVGYKDSSDPHVEGVLTNAPFGRMAVHRVVNGVAERLNLSHLPPWPRTYLSHPFVTEADVVNLHHVHGKAFAYTLIPALSKKRPMVWTLHDMWAMTGWCGYAYDCERWRTGCGACPQIRASSPRRMDTSRLHWTMKARAYRHSRPAIVAPSRWLAGVARESPLFAGLEVHHIPYGIDTGVFRPMNKAMARDLLGLPAEATLALFAADSVAEPRKGARFFEEALRRLGAEASSLGVVLFGQNTSGVATPPAFGRWDLGVLHDERLIAAVYAAADVFVSPSLADNLPNTVLESMACGTPVAASEVGGIPDMVRHMETGYLVPPGDAAALATGLATLLGDVQTRRRMSERARSVVEREFTSELQARRYSELYRELVLSRTTAPAAHRDMSLHPSETGGSS